METSGARAPGEYRSKTEWSQKGENNESFSFFRLRRSTKRDPSFVEAARSKNPLHLRRNSPSSKKSYSLPSGRCSSHLHLDIVDDVEPRLVVRSPHSRRRCRSFSCARDPLEQAVRMADDVDGIVRQVPCLRVLVVELVEIP